MIKAVTAHRGRATPRARARRESGASAVEFALVLPVLMLLVMGIIQFGYYFFAANAASSTAREVARRVAVGDCWDAGAFNTFVQTQVSGMLDVDAAGTGMSPALGAGTDVGQVVDITVTVANTDIIGYVPGIPETVARTFTTRIEDTEATTCS